MGAWTGRFRAAAAACCAAVVLLLVTGLAAGIAYESAVSSAKLPRGAAAYQRAQQLFSGGNLFSAVLLVTAVLLVVVSGDEVEATDRRVLRGTAALAVLVAAAALAMVGVSIWYASVSTGRGVISATTGIVGELLAVVVVAVGAAWWARAAATV